MTLAESGTTQPKPQRRFGDALKEGVAAASILTVFFGAMAAAWANPSSPTLSPSRAEADLQDEIPTPASVTVARTFKYVADRPLKSVHVAGTFNNWDRKANPLVLDADGKTWRFTTTLPYGAYQYKFVLDGETWITDPKAPNAGDGNGNINSILVIQPADYGSPARAGDGIIAASALLHETRVPFRNYDRGVLTLSLRARPADLTAVFLQVSGKRYPMRGTPVDELYERYIAHLPWDRKTDLSYTFEIVDGTRTVRYGANGLDSTQPFVLKAREFQPFVVPPWVEKSVLYQIFPDRFADGDKTNDPPGVVPWNAAPTYGNRFGGDAVGVRQHVGYLSDLGISAVYFNPVFESPSNHRYDTQDFRKIDGQFGTNAEFADLTRDLSQHGIRTVMDFVFNHTAPSFKPFADIRQNGAASPYKDWYFIHSFPVRVGENPNYTAWYNYPSMPKLNVLNPPTRDYLLGTADYWTKEVPLSGMRLDVANEVDPRFWRALRERAKHDNPQMWIVGEVWGDGSPWLTGDQWDSVMDYPFREACVGFFADNKTRPSEFMNGLMALYNRYAPQVSRNLMNLLSSHDTPRFLTLCHGDAELDRLAATVQFTWPGIPSIYYGEELGMEGNKDPDNRRGMRWDLANNANPMLRYYKRLIAIRRSSPALQSGDPEPLQTDDAAGTLAFARVLDDTDAAVVALNRSNEVRTVTVSLPTALRRAGSVREALSGRTIAVSGKTSLSLPLPAHGAVILLPEERISPFPK